MEKVTHLFRGKYDKMSGNMGAGAAEESQDRKLWYRPDMRSLTPWADSQRSEHPSQRGDTDYGLSFR